jgi:hypothetical protein
MFSDESASMQEMDYQNASEYADQSAPELNPLFTTREGRQEILKLIGKTLRNELYLDFRILDRELITIGDLVRAADGIATLADMGKGHSGGNVATLLNLCRAELNRRLPELRNELSFQDAVRRWSPPINQWDQPYRCPVKAEIGAFDLIQARAEIRKQHRAIYALDAFFKAIGRIPDHSSI